MKPFILLLVSAFFLTVLAQQMIWVDGYTRSDGTYVQGHYKSAPDNSTENNYGSYYNSYTTTSRSTRSSSSTYSTYSTSPSTDYSSDRVWVEGYTRSNGTYVAGHWRSR